MYMSEMYSSSLTRAVAAEGVGIKPLFEFKRRDTSFTLSP